MWLLYIDVPFIHCCDFYTSMWRLYIDASSMHGCVFYTPLIFWRGCLCVMMSRRFFLASFSNLYLRVLLYTHLHGDERALFILIGSVLYWHGFTLVIFFSSYFVMPFSFLIDVAWYIRVLHSHWFGIFFVGIWWDCEFNIASHYISRFDVMSPLSKRWGLILLFMEYQGR